MAANVDSEIPATDNRLLGRLGTYAVLAHWASGGMAEIYLARHIGMHGFDKLVALKVLRPEVADDHDFRTMFFDEARVSALLTHPDIVQTYDVGEVNEQVYMALEFVSGETLSRVLRRRKGEPIHRGLALEIIRRVATALHYAHTREDLHGNALDLVHRDVSPSNIMLTFDGGVKLLDFGIAKASARETQTQGGVVKGKFSYMSPEQILGEELDGRSDVFSLGLVFWSLLVGRRAISGKKTDREILQAILQEDVPAPSAVGADSNEVLDAIVLKACARNRDERYQSGEELAVDLQKYLVKAHPDLTPSSQTRAMMAELFAGRNDQIKEIVSATADLASEVRRLKEFESAREMRLAAPAASDRGDPASLSFTPSSSSLSQSVGGEMATRAAKIAARRPPRRKAGLPLAAAGAGVLAVVAAIAFLLWAPTDRSVQIDSEPRGATVLVDGRTVGMTPIELDVSTESHQVALRLEGHRAHAENIEAGDEGVRINAQLHETASTGSVLVEVEPSGAEVRYGDLPPQPGPAVFRDLPLGRADRLIVTAPGYEPVARLIEPAAHAEPLHIVLERTVHAFVNAECHSGPCDLHLDGRNLGVAPIAHAHVPVGREIVLELRRGDEILVSERRTLAAGELVHLTHGTRIPTATAAGSRRSHRRSPTPRPAQTAEPTVTVTTTELQVVEPTAAATPVSAPAPAYPPAPVEAAPVEAAPAPAPAPAPREAQLSVRVGSPRVSGAVDAATMRSRVRTRGGAVEACYRQSYARTSFDGRAQVQFRVGGSGRARDVGVTGDGPADFHSCVARAFAGGGYPASDVTGAQVALTLRMRAR